MGKKGKAKSAQERLIKKRAIKTANKAKYESWRRQGVNTKSKRVRKASKGRSRHGIKGTHPDGHCGNLACMKCYPDIKQLKSKALSINETRRYLLDLLPSRKSKPIVHPGKPNLHPGKWAA